MLLALGYPPDSIFRSHLLPLHLESTTPTSPPPLLRPRCGLPLSLHEVRRPCPPLSRGQCRVES